MSFTVPFHSKEKKGKSEKKLPSPVPRKKLSWELPERQRMRDLSLGSPSAPPGETCPGKQTLPIFKPTYPKFKLDPENNKPGSYYTVSITKVDPENIPFCYSPFTVKKASEENNLPSSSSMVDTKKVKRPPPPEFCSKCRTEHYPPYCARPCKICFGSPHFYCPFFDHVPKGAVFDQDNYEIICGCGNMFNEDKWDCILCDGRPKLRSKYCVFCSKYATHRSHECPHDKVGAARFKAKRDQAFSRKKIPYTG